MAATKKAATKAKADAPAAKTKATRKATTPKAKKSAPKKAAPKTKAAAPKAAPKAKKAVAPKPTEKQTGLLLRIADAGAAGYAALKAEIRAIEALIAKKLVKKGAKDKATGTVPYRLTKAGAKHAPAPATNPVPPPAAPEAVSPPPA